jgi:hypothetical protein
MTADEGDITLRDIWNSMGSMRTELTDKIDDLAKEVRGNACAQRKECDGRMEAHDTELASHSTRIARLEYIVWGVVIVSVVGASLWFFHLAGVVPGFGP